MTITNSYGTSPEYSGIIQPYTTSPGQPETVTVSSISSDSATIRWTKPDLGVDNNYCDRITGYSVYINSVKVKECTCIINVMCVQYMCHMYFLLLFLEA